MTAKYPRTGERDETRAAPDSLGGSDLQYVTQRVAGALFGGWYRVLNNGQRLELLALGSVWQAQRNASAPQRQARAMLAKLARMRSRTSAGIVLVQHNRPA